MTPKTVLVIEDDAVAREGMKAILAREGYAVVPAADGREALDYWRPTRGRTSSCSTCSCPSWTAGSFWNGCPSSWGHAPYP